MQGILLDLFLRIMAARFLLDRNAAVWTHVSSRLPVLSERCTETQVFRRSESKYGMHKKRILTFGALM